jgi:hypothetical protein
MTTKTKTPKPSKRVRINMLEVGIILSLAVLISILALDYLHDWAENRKVVEAPATACCVMPDGTTVETLQAIGCKPIWAYYKLHHHTHTKDAAETAKLNHAMNVQHGVMQ